MPKNRGVLSFLKDCNYGNRKWNNKATESSTKPSCNRNFKGWIKKRISQINLEPLQRYLSFIVIHIPNSFSGDTEEPF